MANKNKRPSQGKGKSKTQPQAEPKIPAGPINYIRKNKVRSALIAVLAFSLGGPLNFFGSSPNILYLPAIALCAVILFYTHEFVTSLKDGRGRTNEAVVAPSPIAPSEGPEPAPAKTPANTEATKEEISEPIFVVESATEYKLKFGTSRMWGDIKRDSLREISHGYLPDSGVPFMSGTVENNRLYIDTQIYAGEHHAPIQLIRNHVVGLPPDWDANFDEDAIEIVNDSGKPVLQLEYSANSLSLSLLGQFWVSKDETMCATTSGEMFVKKPRPLLDLGTPLLFQYPSKTFPHVRVQQR